MFRRELVLMAVLLAFGASNIQAARIPCTWVGGSNGCWCDPCNWSCGLVPDNSGANTFDVTIGGGQVGLGQSRTINQLTCSGSVELENWAPSNWVGLRLEDVNGLRNHGNLESGIQVLASKYGVHNYTGTIAFQGELNSEDDVQNAGEIVITPGGELSVEIHSLDNSGQITIYRGDCSAEDIVNTGIIRGFGTVHTNQTLQNSGEIWAYGGSLAIGIEAGPSSNTGLLSNIAGSTLHIGIVGLEDVNNTGTIEVNPGGSVAFDCNLSNEPNGIIRLLGGTLAATKITQKAGAMFEGDGKISGNLVIDPNAEVALTGPTEIYGDVQIDENAVLDINDGTTLIKGHCTCNNGTIHLNGGWLIPQGGLTNNNCNIVWQPGLYTNVADFNLDGKVDFKDFANFADTWLWQTQW